MVDAGLNSFPNHKWADPDPEELHKLMRHLKENPKEASAKGKQARIDVLKKWSNDQLSSEVARHLERLSGRKESIRSQGDDDAVIQYSEL